MDVGLFLREVAKAPGRMGAVWPSSPYLARLMCEAADLRDEHVIVELGAGTGPVTRAIRAACPTAPLLALEPGEELAAHLRATFPDVAVSATYAQDLVATAAAWGHPRADRVVSSLPWTVFPAEAAEAGLSAVAEVLGPDGRMVTFTYVHAVTLLPGGARLRELLARHFARVERTRVEWRNLPPALVYVCDGPRGAAAP